MDEEHSFTEWQKGDVLPDAFVIWLNETITEKAMKERKRFVQIARALDMDAVLLSRWLAGMGPLSKEHILKLANNLSQGGYTVLGLKWPDNPRRKILCSGDFANDRLTRLHSLSC